MRASLLVRLLVVLIRSRGISMSICVDISYLYETWTANMGSNDADCLHAQASMEIPASPVDLYHLIGMTLTVMSLSHLGQIPVAASV